MNIRKLTAILIALVLTLAITPPLAQTAKAASISYTFPHYCDNGYWAWKTVGNPGDPNGGTHREPDPHYCEHGQFISHWYDDYGHCSRTATVLDYSNNSIPSDSKVTLAYAIDWASKLPSNLPTGATLSVTYNNYAKSNFYGGDTKYLIPNEGYAIKFQSNVHFPIVCSLDSYTKIYDSCGGILVATGAQLNSMTLKIGATTGNVTLGKSTATKYSHTATLCSNSAGEARRVSTEHKYIQVSSSSNTYYDKNGNVVGGGGSVTLECVYCGSTATQGSGTTWNGGYSGDYYDKDGKK